MHPMIIYRERHGLTQEQLAQQLGIERTQITRYEGGRRPQRSRRVRIERLTNGEIPADSWEGGKK